MEVHHSVACRMMEVAVQLREVGVRATLVDLVQVLQTLVVRGARVVGHEVAALELVVPQAHALARLAAVQVMQRQELAARELVVLQVPHLQEGLAARGLVVVPSAVGSVGGQAVAALGLVVGQEVVAPEQVVGQGVAAPEQVVGQALVVERQLVRLAEAAYQETAAFELVVFPRALGEEAVVPAEPTHLLPLEVQVQE